MVIESAHAPSPLRVLIADDAAVARLDLGQALEELGYEICAEARDGTQAVARAEAEKPDLAILDVEMPGLDGIEAARRILARRSIPIVMLTAHGDDERVAQAVGAGVFGCLVKPYRTRDLKPTIETAHARHADLVARGRVATADRPDEQRVDYYLSGYGYVV